ncbi:hypothetical protein ABZX12_26195 [Kribbella sp. NPDC003505]|uniref:hypothetical protein n=1 Tax=Kribbella sp. NPDC003505 TaxID=3154448 RepID=UPI0033B53CEB
MTDLHVVLGTMEFGGRIDEKTSAPRRQGHRSLLGADDTLPELLDSYGVDGVIKRGGPSKRLWRGGTGTL